jgi:hypothetical protein
MRKKTIEDAQALAVSHGGLCLSPVYKDCKTKMLWECSEQKHTWWANLDNIQQGTWCPFCADKDKSIPMTKIRDLAEKMGGSCLSEVYKNVNSVLTWKCKEDHIFCMRYISVQMGRWCQICTNPTLSIIDAQVLASGHGGCCLSKEYKNAHKKLDWLCSENHYFKATYNNVQQGTWCAVCAGLAKKSLEDIQAIALEKGGCCLEKEYINNRASMSWQCKNKHVWTTPWANIQAGKWCPKCQCKTEQKVREILEQLTGCEFPSVHKKEFVNPETGYLLQLDCYSDVLKIAVEYDGQQHAMVATWLDPHDTEEKLQKRIQRDNLKDRLCVAAGIRLIRVPYTVKEADLKNYIAGQLMALAIPTDMLGAKL